MTRVLMMMVAVLVAAALTVVAEEKKADAGHEAKPAAEGEKAAKEGEGGKAGDKPVEAPQMNQGRIFTQTEAQLLMELDQQRVELERRTQAVELREKLVDLMEQKLNGRVAELQQLKVELEKLLTSVSGKDEKELTQLASIYGAMKPATAAGVLNRLDNAIVLDVLVRMPPKKSGKIMESLDPAKARILSEMMAARTAPPQVSATTPATK